MEVFEAWAESVPQCRELMTLLLSCFKLAEHIWVVFFKSATDLKPPVYIFRAQFQRRAFEK